MSLQRIVSFMVRSTLIPVFAVSVLAVPVLSGCATNEDAADAAQSGAGVFSVDYQAKYREYHALLEQLFQSAKTKYEAGSLSRDEFFPVKAGYDRARLGMLLLENGRNPDDSPYPFLLIKVKAMQACENEMKKFDFMTACFNDELTLNGLMMKISPESVEAAAAAVDSYPASDLTAEQLEVLAGLNAPKAFEASPVYISRFEELALKLTAAHDACKAEYDAGKLPEKDLVILTALLDKTHVGLKRLQKGLSARPGLIERFLDVYVYTYLYRLVQEDLHTDKAAYIQAFEIGSEKLKTEVALSKDWRVDDRLQREISAFHLPYPRSPLSDEIIDKAVEVRARRAPAEGSYSYVRKVKELVANRLFLNGFCKAEYEAGRLPAEVFVRNTYLWDLDRVTLAGLEEGENRETGGIEAVLTLKFREYLVKNHDASRKTGKSLDELKVELLEAELDELGKTAAMSANSLKTLRRSLAGYPEEPLKDSQIKMLLKPKKETDSVARK